jgi:hypothetical protein
VYQDLNDCPYEICGADHYGPFDNKAAEFNSVDNPTNSLAMVRTLFEALVDFSQVLGLDEELRPQWLDILQHLAPYPTNVQHADGYSPGQIFVDWDRAPNPPKGDNQMLGVIQLIYPAGQACSSSANRTLFETAKNTMDYVDNWHASSDAACVMYQISTRLNYNQTEIYPSFAWAFSSKPRPGYSNGNLLENGMTQAQNAAGSLQYANELLVRSDEPFVRFFPGHFSSITAAQHGLPLPLPQDEEDLHDEDLHEEDQVIARQGGVCNITGVWYDLWNAPKFPKNKFELKLVGGSTASWRIDQPNEWQCEVFVNETIIPGTPATPAVPRVASHPECGVEAPRRATQAAHSAFGFFWPAHGTGKDTLQNMVPTPDCRYLCFSSPAAAAQSHGQPYGRAPVPAPSGICNFATDGGGKDSGATPWLNSSFSGMRVKGAQGTEACPLSAGLCTFLVRASLSERGEVSDIAVHSERGGNFTFLSPFPASSMLAVNEDGGAMVPLRVWAPAGLFHLETHEAVFAFETTAGASYVISQHK